MRFTLLYQCGLANVFRLDADGWKRVLQHAYSACEWYCAGLIDCGGLVAVRHWDGAGDALACQNEWTDGAGELWMTHKRPPVK